jgi:3-(3-hydroxy-phenyl)propionate hydroxylase
VGADGASSVVRKDAGIDFEGFTYPEKFLVVSTPYDFASRFPGLSSVNYVADPQQWCVLLRTTLLWRVLFPTRPGQDEDELLSDAYLQRELQALTDDARTFEIGHRTLYRIHQRVAQTFRRGRIVLIGDAAHINNPLGGMGMNGSVHDAFNLGAKLGDVLEGIADERQLDLYDVQRRTIARRFVHEQTMRNKQALEERDPGSQSRRLAELKATSADPARARQFLLRTSMIDSLREAGEIRL